jgi:hypothetical protein
VGPGASNGNDQGGSHPWPRRRSNALPACLRVNGERFRRREPATASARLAGGAAASFGAVQAQSKDCVPARRRHRPERSAPRVPEGLSSSFSASQNIFRAASWRRSWRSAINHPPRLLLPGSKERRRWPTSGSRRLAPPRGVAYWIGVAINGVLFLAVVWFLINLAFGSSAEDARPPAAD